MQFRNGVFIITEDDHCPLYNVREELKVSDGILLLPAAKPTCLTLAKDFVEIAHTGNGYEKHSQGKPEKAKFECGGCTGLIRFEYKKDKEFATVQMKLLAAAERRGKFLGVRHFAGLLRSLAMFQVLSDNDLLDLASLLELTEFPRQFLITQKGDPGNRLFILLSGRAEVIDEKGVVLSQLGEGQVFGEMSLLSGERVSTTVIASEPCQFAVMSHKNFKHVLSRFPTLQVFFYKLLVSRITRMKEQQAEDLSSGMVGQISDVSIVELSQMVNSNQKTGRLHLENNERRGSILFNEGELVYAEYEGVFGKDAFYEIIGIENGRFKFIQGLTHEEKKLDVLGGFMGIIMEGMKRLDDRS